MILHIADLHADLKWYKWLVGISHRYSLVCLAGDLLDLNPYRSYAGQLEEVIPLLCSVRTKLAVVSGNHDLLAGDDPRLENASWLQEVRETNVAVDGDTLDLPGGFKLRCLGWQAPLPLAGPSELWLHHSPPRMFKTAVSRGGCDFGDFDLGEHLKEGLGPRVVLSGHVHDPVRYDDRSIGCCSLNPGHAGNTLGPNYYEIDIAAGVATHHRASGAINRIRLW
jgi:predicted phosphodiesterase